MAKGYQCKHGHEEGGEKASSTLLGSQCVQDVGGSLTWLVRAMLWERVGGHLVGGFRHGVSLQDTSKISQESHSRTP